LIYHTLSLKSNLSQKLLLIFADFIRESFVRGEHNVAIFFDLDKAYDTTWKYGIMKDLFDLGLQGHLPGFIENFLNDRTCQVRLSTTLSDPFEQEMGVPQGSILSVTLFSIKINSIVQCLRAGTDASLYVDDFQISYSSQNMNIIERQLQQCVNRLQVWADENGFKFSTSKSVCIHFCRKRKLHLDPQLTLNGNTLPVVESTKFLGVIFDKKLNFLAHIKYLKLKCQKALNLLRVVSSMDLGADRRVLLRLYT